MSLNAMRMITDHINSVGGVGNFNILKSFLSYIKALRQRYKFYLDAVRKPKADEEDMIVLRKKVKILKQDRDMLDREFRILMNKSAKTWNNELLVQANSLRKDSEVKAVEIAFLEQCLKS